MRVAGALVCEVTLGHVCAVDHGLQCEQAKALDRRQLVLGEVGGAAAAARLEHRRELGQRRLLQLRGVGLSLGLLACRCGRAVWEGGVKQMGNRPALTPPASKYHPAPEYRPRR
eukprot:123495-Chlamydomonas_euryale.AAC.1